jgi:hypothetical protein
MRSVTATYIGVDAVVMSVVVSVDVMSSSVTVNVKGIGVGVINDVEVYA